MNRVTLALLLTVSTLPLRAADTVKNADGTQSTTYTEQDEIDKNKAKAYDPYSRTAGDSAHDFRNVSKDNEAKFPEEQKRKMEKEIERSKLTPEQKAKEKRMIDRTPALTKNYNPTIQERDSIPKRF